MIQFSVLCEIGPGCQPMFVLIVVLTVVGAIGAVREAMGKDA